MKILGTDKETLSACALVAREFTFSALCCLGRHIALNTVRRLRECARLVTRGSAFQHVRSLDIGITTKRPVQERDWDDYLAVLETFARRRTLTRLWLSEVPFYFSKLRKQEAVGSIITSLAATVNELGLHSCRFSSYTEMISLIRAFPLCTSLHVRDCVTRKTPGADVFAKLPQHTLHISDLEFTSSFGHRLLSALIKDAALDVSSLSGFFCDASTADAAHHTVMTVVSSPVGRFQLVCDEADGFHGMSRLYDNPHVPPYVDRFTKVLADPAITRWPLKSLTIGPLVLKDNSWCERALEFSPKLPRLESVTIRGCIKRPIRRPFRFWRRVDELLSREVFPHLELVDICITVGSRRRLHPSEHNIIARDLPTLHSVGKLYFWGEKCELTSRLQGINF